MMTKQMTAMMIMITWIMLTVMSVTVNVHLYQNPSPQNPPLSKPTSTKTHFHQNPSSKTYLYINSSPKIPPHPKPISPKIHLHQNPPHPESASTKTHLPQNPHQQI